MYFKRNISNDLENWKNHPNRKPLIVMGARQVGKTTTIKTFAENHFSDMAYFNFERQPEIHSFFQQSKDPQRIITNLSLIHGKEIEPKKTLLVFDEVQDCRDALIALKYFQEETPEYAIIAAGSLLGITLGNDRSFPVGKVAFMDIYPLSFSEYLSTVDEKHYKIYLHVINENKIDQLPDAFFNPLMDIFKQYLISGGMPEVAAHFAVSKNLEQTQEIQDQILRSYQMDFAKHTDSATATRIQYVWDSLPAQLSKENKKFLYSVIKTGARARSYEDAITWLEQAGLVAKIYRIKKPGLPLSAYRDLSAFKLYMLDIGLLQRMARLDPTVHIAGNSFFTEFKGAIAENYVAQCFQRLFSDTPGYWTSKGQAEVDFLIPNHSKIFPVEVKSGMVTKSKSLLVYQQKFILNSFLLLIATVFKMFLNKGFVI